MELGLILGRNLEKPGKRQNLGVFQGQILHFCRFPGFPGHLATLNNTLHVPAQHATRDVTLSLTLRHKTLNVKSKHVTRDVITR